MCLKCEGHPACPCACTFVKDVDLFQTVVVFRGIPITHMACRECGHRKGERVAHKVRVRIKSGM